MASLGRRRYGCRGSGSLSRDPRALNLVGDVVSSRFRCLASNLLARKAIFIVGAAAASTAALGQANIIMKPLALAATDFDRGWGCQS